MLKLKLQYFSHLIRKSCLITKGPDAGKDWRQEEKGTTEDKMVGWHHQLNGHEIEQGPGRWWRTGSLVCCSPWSAESHTQLSETKQQWPYQEKPIRIRYSSYSVAVRLQKCLCILNTAKYIFHTTHSNLKVSKHRSYTFIHFNQSDSTSLNSNNLTPQNPSLLSYIFTQLSRPYCYTYFTKPSFGKLGTSAPQSLNAFIA